MKINEIFYSIQGEGKWTGLPNIFIRTTGCNLRCTYCDTKYAYEKGIEKSIQDIEKEIRKYECKKICITGGEPLLQKETMDLVALLLKEGYLISIETNGSIDIKPLIKKEKILISMDVKCPSSKMHEKMLLENIEHLEEKDQIKFIIADKNDYKYANEIIGKYKPKCDVFFQPVWNSSYETLSKWIINDNLNVKLGIQLHKIIWGDKKGV